MTRRAGRAYRGPHRSPSMVRHYHALRTRWARRLVEGGRRTPLLDLLAEALGEDAAAGHAAVLAVLLDGAVDDQGLSRIRLTTAAARLGRCKRTVQRYLERLVDAAVLVRHPAPREPVEGTGEWVSTGTNGYELNPAVLDALIAADNANRPPPPAPANPSQPPDYRGDSPVTSTLTGSRRAARHGAAGPPGHHYTDDGGGLCASCALPAANRRHAPDLTSTTTPPQGGGLPS